MGAQECHVLLNEKNYVNHFDCSIIVVRMEKKSCQGKKFSYIDSAVFLNKFQIK